MVAGFGPTIDFWFSESSDVTGAWASQPVLEIGGAATGPGCFSYAAKAHPSLQLLRDELVLSYVTNTVNVSQLAEPGVASVLYTPQVASLQIASASSLMIILLSALLSAFVLAGAIIALVFVARLRQKWAANTAANSSANSYAPLN